MAPLPRTSCDSDIVKPRSGFLPRQRALIALSWSTSVAEAFDSAISWKRCVRPTRRTADAEALAPRTLEGEPAAVDDRLVAQVEGREPARGVQRHARLAGGEQRRGPGPLLAHLEELVEHVRPPTAARRSGRRRPARSRRCRCRRGTPRRRGRRRSSCRRAARSRPACPSRRCARGAWRAPSRPRCAGARGQRPEQQDREHDQADDAQRDQRRREVDREERRPVGVRAVEPDEAAEHRLQHAADAQLRGDPAALRPERDDAEDQHGDQVERHEPDQAEQRRRVGRRAEGPPVGDERDQHADAERAARSGAAP